MDDGGAVKKACATFTVDVTKEMSISARCIMVMVMAVVMVMDLFMDMIEDGDGLFFDVSM